MGVAADAAAGAAHLHIFLSIGRAADDRPHPWGVTDGLGFLWASNGIVDGQRPLAQSWWSVQHERHAVTDKPLQ